MATKIHMIGTEGKPLCGNVKAMDPESITKDSKLVTCKNCKIAIKAGIRASKENAKKEAKKQ